MYKFKTMRPLVQAMGIITAVMVMVTGVTFAALQSQRVVLKGNSILTAVADLSLSTDNVTYSKSITGFNFSGLIPGGSPVPTSGYGVYLRNDGSTALTPRISVDPSLVNPSLVDLNKVHVIISSYGGGAGQNVTLQDLVAANTTGGLAITVTGATKILNGSNVGFTMQIAMDSDAVTGASANLSNLIFDFDATAVN